MPCSSLVLGFADSADGNEGYGWMARYDSLDFCGVHVEAGRKDHVLLPIDDEDTTVIVRRIARNAGSRTVSGLLGVRDFGAGQPLIDQTWEIPALVKAK